MKKLVNMFSIIKNKLPTFKLPESLGQIFLIVFIWRVCLEAINQFIVPLIGSYGGVSSFIDGITRWGSWDGNWYLGIVTTGYHYNSVIASTVQQNVAFFPGFPFVVRMFHDIFRLSYLYSGLLINFLLTVGIVFIACELYVIFCQKYNHTNQKQADTKLTNIWPVIIVLSLPTVFFFAAFYADALLVFCLMSAIYFGLKKKYLMSAIFAGLATGVNPIGVVAAPAILIMFIEQELVLKNSIKSIIKKYFLKLIAISLLSINGIIFYMLYLWYRFKDPLAFYKSEKAWGRASSSSFFSNMSNIWHAYYPHFFNLTYFGNAKFEYLIALSDMILPFLALIILIISIHKKVWWLFTYTLILILLPISTGSLGSLNRFALGLIPALIFIYALLSKKIIKYIWIPISLMAITQIIFIVIFLQNLILYLVG